MLIKAEATIDLDEHRKVWVTISAKTVDGEDPTDIIPVMAEKIVEAAMESFEQGAAQLGIPTAPDPLQTFGD